MTEQNRVLLIVSGGIAACKCPELIRLLKRRGFEVRCILTRGGARFITPMTLAALSGDKVYEDLFSLTDESEMGHIRLTRQAGLVLVAPATANIMARMANGIADDLATTALLAAKVPIMAAPAMNVAMWEHPATRDNIETLKRRGVRLVGPTEGEMACGEWGMGRMAEPPDIAEAVEDLLLGGGGKMSAMKKLKGRRALVTSGPTLEAIDPVRYIANRSSGKQGHAIAAAIAGQGADTTLVSGPTRQPDPERVKVVHVETAVEMLAACERELPVDIAVCAAAVSDWRAAKPSAQKIKKTGKKSTASLALIENPDILGSLCAAGERRPRLVVGFAAETEKVIENAAAKRKTKGCDWIVANDVSKGSGVSGVMGADTNTVHLITSDGAESWPEMTKAEVGLKLAVRIADALELET